MKVVILLIAACCVFCGTATARVYEFEEPNCYYEYGEIECGSRSSALGRFVSNAITWLGFVVLMPAIIIYFFGGAVKESKLTDLEWRKRYPGRTRTKNDRQLGIGFYLMTASVGAGVAFMWLLVVSPSTLKWLGMM